MPDASAPYPEIRYRLEKGERFAIVGTAHRIVRLKLPRLEPRTLQDLNIRFVLDCEVTELLDGELPLRTDREARAQ